LKNHSQKRAAGMTQGVGPEFKPHYCKKNKTKQKLIKSSQALVTQPPANSSQDPISKSPLQKKGWWRSSTVRAPA
jgi:hypothetical protein